MVVGDGLHVRYDLETGLLAEDRSVELLQRAARLDPELLDERLPRLLVSGQRLCLPA